MLSHGSYGIHLFSTERSIIDPIEKPFTTTTLLATCIAMIIGVDMNAQFNSKTLDVNDVSARLQSNGLIGYDPTAGVSDFFVPAADGLSPLRASGLWLAGRTFDLQLRVSAHLYGAPYDFTTGPLSTLDGSLNSGTEGDFDRVWSVSGQELEDHARWWDCISTPDCDPSVLFPDGYTIPSDISNWPAEGDVGMGQTPYLAPFADEDVDGYYDPLEGDQPCIPGDKALYIIFNDDAQSRTGGVGMSAEIRMMLFAYDRSVPALDQTIFAHYQIYNRSTTTLEEMSIGIFGDLDIGCPTNDIIGTDVGRNMVFGLNRTATDNDCSGVGGYGDSPPAFAIKILKGPLVDGDGIDNTGSPIIPAFNGLGFGDGINDNERHRLSRSMYFNATGNAAMTDPVTENHYWNYAQGVWKNNVIMSHGGSGYSEAPTAEPAAFAFPRNSDPQGVGTGGEPLGSWSDGGSSSPAGDRKVLALSGPFTFDPGNRQELLVAYIFQPGSANGTDATLSALAARADSIESIARELPGLLGAGNFCDRTWTSSPEISSAQPFRLYPNPVSEILHIQPNLGQPGTLSVLDSRGVVVMNGPIMPGPHAIDVRGLPSGVYTLRTDAPYARRYARFVKH